MWAPLWFAAPRAASVAGVRAIVSVIAALRFGAAGSMRRRTLGHVGHARDGPGNAARVRTGTSSVKRVDSVTRVRPAVSCLHSTTMTEPNLFAARVRAAAADLAALEPAARQAGPWPLAAVFDTSDEAAWGPPEVLAHVD